MKKKKCIWERLFFYEDASKMKATIILPCHPECSEGPTHLNAQRGDPSTSSG